MILFYIKKKEEKTQKGKGKQANRETPFTKLWLNLNQNKGFGDLRV